MKTLTYCCTFFGTAACTFVGASQNTPRTWEGWLFLTIGSLGAGAIALKSLITEPMK
jgi:hypothetical protein